MIHSMTGFGRAACDLQNHQLSIEVKSLNSKQLDVNCKIPYDFRNKEIEIRNITGSMLIRGKIDITMSFEQNTALANADINNDLLKEYYNKLAHVSDELALEKSDRLMLAALKMPDVITNNKLNLDDLAWNSIKEKLVLAVGQCIEFRLQEGEALKNDLNERINNIIELLNSVQKHETARIETIRKRIKDNMDEYLDKSNMDENRFEQEMIYYIEKIDISEEKIRLSNHCSYFLETMNEKEPVGKKLNFISQEIGREINTLGSKANDFDIQRIVVQMKDELEKIKEQVLNVL